MKAICATLANTTFAESTVGKKSSSFVSTRPEVHEPVSISVERILSVSYRLSSVDARAF